MREITARLARLKPPIVVAESVVSRDLKTIRGEMVRYYSARGFDAVVEIGKKLAGYEAREARCHRLARRSKDPKEIALLYRVANESARLYTELLQDIGMLDRNLGTLWLRGATNEKPAERMPTGEEMQRRFSEIEVVEGEIMSQAERDWLHGDAAVSTAAAMAADGDRSEDGEDHGGEHPEGT